MFRAKSYPSPPDLAYIKPWFSPAYNKIITAVRKLIAVIIKISSSLNFVI